MFIIRFLLFFPCSSINNLAVFVCVITADDWIDCRCPSHKSKAFTFRCSCKFRRCIPFFQIFISLIREYYSWRTVRVYYGIRFRRFPHSVQCLSDGIVLSAASFVYAQFQSNRISAFIDGIRGICTCCPSLEGIACFDRYCLCNV